ncbi:MAG: TonB family protein [Acinetobacter tjernbergiae]
MSQSPAIFNMPHSMKKKIITALVAVVIGHVGVLWAVSHMKPIKLKPIEKKPLKVRILTIKEDVPPPPPPPAKIEPIKPKVEPKKIEPVLIEKPKIISQKVQKVEPKAIQQDDTQEKLKKLQDLEKQRLDQLKHEQELKEQQAREQALREQQAREQALRDQKASEQAQKNQEAQSPAVGKVSAGDAEWAMGQKWVNKQVKDALNEFSQKYSKIKGEFTLTLNLSVNEEGKITSVTVEKSSGNPKVDQKMIQVISRQRFKPRMVNGVAEPFTVPLPFAIGLK